MPLYRSRAQQFDDLVLDAVARLEPRWESELSGIEFAVQEVPDEEIRGDDLVPVPLARIDPGENDPHAPAGARSPRIVIYRRPLLARAEDEDELSELIFDVVVEEVAEEEIGDLMNLMRRFIKSDLPEFVSSTTFSGSGKVAARRRAYSVMFACR